MYFKLMVRSLWRHQKRGRRLFVLLALCSAALSVLLTFQADFGVQYRDLFIGNYPTEFFVSIFSLRGGW